MIAAQEQRGSMGKGGGEADGQRPAPGVHLKEPPRLDSGLIALTEEYLHRPGETAEVFLPPGQATACPGKIHTYDDHRMAMGFSLTGLRAEGIEIDDPGCCRKTFAQYFEVLDGVMEELIGE